MGRLDRSLERWPVLARKSAKDLRGRKFLAPAQPRADTKSRNPDQAVLAWTRDWLAEPLASAVTDLRATRKRIVQETVGQELLATTSLADWF